MSPKHNPMLDLFMVYSLFAFIMLGVSFSLMGEDQPSIEFRINPIDLSSDGSSKLSLAPEFAYVFDVTLSKDTQLSFHSNDAPLVIYVGLDDLLNTLRPLPHNIVLVRLFIDQDATAQHLIGLIEEMQKCGIQNIEYVHQQGT